MDILEKAIAIAGGVGKLADALDTKQSVVSNWRVRGLPKPWEQVLRLKYQAELAQAHESSAQEALPS